MGTVTKLEQRRARLSSPAPLKPGHILTNFDCSRTELNDWLKERAWKAVESETARTYVVCRGTKKVVGYFSLVAGAVDRDQAPRALSRNTPHPIPVIILARLAVDKDEAGQGLGRALLAEGMKRSAAAARIIGAKALLIHALNEKAAAFYKKLQFIPFSDDSQTLYLPMKTIRLAL